MLKKLLLLASLVLATALPMLADQITFSFVASMGNAVDLMASAGSGMQSGPADNIAVSDTTLGLHLPLAGIFTSSAGPGTTFGIGPSFVVANFGAGASDSVLITDPVTGAVLVAGTMQANGAMLAQYPSGAGSFLGTFTVTEVAPSVLADFGLAGFNPNGSLSFTFGQDQVNSLGVLDAVVGGGTVTIVATPTNESSSGILLSLGLCGVLASGWLKKSKRP